MCLCCAEPMSTGPREPSEPPKPGIDIDELFAGNDAPVEDIRGRAAKPASLATGVWFLRTAIARGEHVRDAEFITSGVSGKERLLHCNAEPSRTRRAKWSVESSRFARLGVVPGKLTAKW